MKLDILLICKNNEFYFKYIFPNLLSKLESLETSFYIYENNSSDKTPQILRKLEENNKNIKIFSEINNQKSNRYYNIIEARNRLVKLYLKKKFKLDTFVLWLDTNIIFSSQTIPNLINIALKTPHGMMFNAFTYYNYENIESDKYYYDILAYNYGKFFKTIHSPNLTFSKMLVESRQSNTNKLLNVDTAFGGLTLMRTIILQNFTWEFEKPVRVMNPLISNQIICEHWSYCEKVKTLGNIYIVKDSQAIWFLDKDITKIRKYLSLIN